MRHTIFFSILLTALSGCGNDPVADQFVVQFPRYTRSHFENETFKPGRDALLKIHDAMESEMRSETLITAILEGDAQAIHDMDSDFSDKPIAQAVKELRNAVTVTIEPLQDDQEQVTLSGRYEHPEVAQRVFNYLAERYRYRMMEATEQAFLDERQDFNKRAMAYRRRLAELETEQLRLLSQGAPQSEIDEVKQKIEALSHEVKVLDARLRAEVALTIAINTEPPPDWLVKLFEMEVPAE